MFVHCFLIKKHIYFNQSLLNLSVLIFKSNDVNGDCNLNVTSWTISNLETLFYFSFLFSNTCESDNCPV